MRGQEGRTSSETCIMYLNYINQWRYVLQVVTRLRDLTFVSGLFESVVIENCDQRGKPALIFGLLKSLLTDTGSWTLPEIDMSSIFRER